MTSRGHGATLITTLSPVRTSPKWSFRGREGGGSTPDHVPGPGAYAPIPSDRDKFTAAPKFGFGSSSRDGLMGVSQPGPGQYKPEDPNMVSARWGFGTSTRGPIGKTSSGPGPGAYELRSTLSGSKWTTSARRIASTGSLGTPGPGQYATHLITSGPTFESAPRYGFGSSGRSRVGTNKAPGPGTYELPNSSGSPRWSLRGRWPSNTPSPHKSSPGPGAHGGQYTQFGY